ncbi:hypothetical protein Afe04nite_79920 [Asanoa ferruginea]|uniref:hypothetical protein n=1 Tax=Asanoa ferruginea TaxID=53367 RepID=UPI000E239308|nr:hypothetical protein [Asanoa ferruginea]GIF53453.1 hypothetical protein Afe04nite_79920 [Asanoa ferruginea]
MSTPGRKPRGRALLSFLVAMVLLAVIGATGGWLYGQRVADRRAADGGGGGEPTQPEVTSEPPSGEPCREETEAAAENAGSPGGLVEILYIRTEDNKQVWICRDTAGSIFYQGYVGPLGGELREGENALFLTTVAETAGGYLATNETDDGTTIYSVTPYRLTQSTNGKESTFPVAERRQG